MLRGGRIHAMVLWMSKPVFVNASRVKSLLKEHVADLELVDLLSEEVDKMPCRCPACLEDDAPLTEQDELPF